ncbi:HEPN/Toprim-associated domain-containing protein [Burkholderia gladioli]|uniref:HEPN/Toprim-associated domain-containing protein n=1 Tax=Burkholderia gladioli TaxID=28095 RepID=UPI002445F7EC|nr:HEPN/Toprim-associated domain-containing protein [Burkholderia gladioli]
MAPNLTHLPEHGVGTEIHLEVGGVSIDWSKNNAGTDHRSLFQEGDRARLPSEEADDESQATHPEDDALVRTLARVLPRLDLMGWTLDAARAEYNALVDGQSDIAKEIGRDTSGVMTFDEFCAFAGRYRLADLDDTYIDDSHEWNSIVKGRFRADEAEMDRLPMSYDSLYWSEKSYFASRVVLLSPYSMLQVFGLSQSNLNADVVWEYGPLVDAGWASVSDFAAGASRPQKILVATEGTTDSRILKRAFSTLRPDIADFFRFVDVDERHPFWGTGNLIKFAEGLVRIDIQNKVLFILDNDAEGVDALKRLKDLQMPPNMRAILLPDHEAFRNFPAIGPEGTRVSDINGRAAAIECYLDLRLPNYGPPVVRWSNYKKDIDAWQGALEHKETYMRHFLEQAPETLRNGGYDTAKLDWVLDAITIQATLLQQHRLD